MVARLEQPLGQARRVGLVQHLAWDRLLGRRVNAGCDGRDIVPLLAAIDTARVMDVEDEAEVRLGVQPVREVQRVGEQLPVPYVAPESVPAVVVHPARRRLIAACNVLHVARTIMPLVVQHEHVEGQLALGIARDDLGDLLARVRVLAAPPDAVRPPGLERRRPRQRDEVLQRAAVVVAVQEEVEVFADPRPRPAPLPARVAVPECGVAVVDDGEAVARDQAELHAGLQHAVAAVRAAVAVGRVHRPVEVAGRAEHDVRPGVHHDALVRGVERLARAGGAGADDVARTALGERERDVEGVAARRAPRHRQRERELDVRGAQRQPRRRQCVCVARHGLRLAVREGDRRAVRRPAELEPHHARRQHAEPAAAGQRDGARRSRR